ncbi:MAG: type II toxin-antitoxin system VapC family toxin [Anaerolineae bacterium]
MASVVIDANFGVALVRLMPYSGACRTLMEQWIQQKVAIAAPDLWYYEIVSALYWLQTRKEIEREAARAGIDLLFRLNLVSVPLDRDLAIAAINWAERLEQGKAYDAQYLALAERLNAEFYTADKKLFNRCRQIGVQFVKLLA